MMSASGALEEGPSLRSYGEAAAGDPVCHPSPMEEYYILLSLLIFYVLPSDDKAGG